MSEERHTIHTGVRKDCSRECSEMGRVQTSVKHILIFLVIAGLFSVIFDIWTLVRVTAADKEMQSVIKRLDIQRVEMDDLRKLHTVIPIPKKEEQHNGK